MKLLLLLPLAGMAMVLSACGGGGGGDATTNAPSPGNVSTVGGAKHELGNLGSILAAADLANALQPLGSTSQPVPAKSGSVPCNAGGSQMDSGLLNGPFSVQYFDAVSGGYHTYENTDCVHTSSDGTTTTTTTTNGHAESGTNGQSNSDPRSFDYFVHGDSGSGTPYRYQISVSGPGNQQSKTGSFLGGLETATDSSSGAIEIKAAHKADYSENINGVQYSYSLTLGSDSAPMDVAQDSGGALSFNGTYAYHSSACQGGTFTVKTDEAIVFSDVDPNTDDDAQSGGDPTPIVSVPTSGVVEIGTGTDTLTITFGPDGSATFSGSYSGSLTLYQVNDILRAPHCRINGESVNNSN